LPNIRISISGLGKDFARIQTQVIAKLSEKHIEAIARETEVVIKAKIKERIEREGSTGNLANSFTTVKIPDGWGVGDIDFLNTQAPYWYWQNFGKAQSGRTTPPRSRGQFGTGNPQPIAGGGRSKWNQNSNGQYLIDPKKPIEAKNYIQATLNEVNKIISSVVRTIKL
jgi:hypothetical protein